MTNVSESGVAPLKIIVLGDIEAGKSSIVQTLMRKCEWLADPDGRTIGIEVNNFKLDQLDLIVYDFGGHRSYFSTHLMFCSSKTVYLLVVDSSCFQRSKYHEQMSHWFYSVTCKSITPIFIVVASKQDKCENIESVCDGIIRHLNELEEITLRSLKRERNSLGDELELIQNKFNQKQVKKTQIEQEKEESVLEKRLERTEFLIQNRPVILQTPVPVSVKDSNSMKDLIEVINDTAREYKDKLPSRVIPLTWVNASNEILNMTPFIKIEKFHKTCKELGIEEEDEQRKVLDYLVNAGSVLSFRDLDKHQTDDKSSGSEIPSHSGTVFTDPTWLLSILGSVHHHQLHEGKFDHPLLKAMPGADRTHTIEKLKQAIVPRQLLTDLLEEKIKERSMFEVVMKYFEKFDLCFPLPHSTDSSSNEEYFLFPTLLVTGEGKSTSKWDDKCPAGVHEYKAVMQYNTEKVPHGFLEKVGVKINPYLQNRTNWKGGLMGKFQLKNGKGDLRLELKCINNSECILLSFRVTKDGCDEGRGILQAVLSIMQYSPLHYPGVIFSLNIPCSKCILEAEDNADLHVHMWFADDKFLAPNAQNRSLICSNDHEIDVKELFPIRGIYNSSIY